MADVEINVKTIDQNSEELQKTEGNLKKLEAAAGDAKKETSKLGETLNDTVVELTGFNLTQLSVAGAIGLAANAMREAIEEYSGYVDSIRELSSVSGVAVEDVSRLVQVADDLRIEQTAVENAMRMSVQNGFVPTIENVARLADEYVATADPAERARIAQEKFGKAWSDLAPLLEKGGDYIRDNTQALDGYLVVTDEAIRKSNAYQKAMDDWGDATTEVKFELANGLLPVLTGLINTTMAASKETDTFGERLLASIPVIGAIYSGIKGLTAQQEEAAIATETASEAYDQATWSTDQLAEAQELGADAVGDWSASARDAKVAAEAAASGVGSLAEATDDTTQSLDTVMDSMKEVTKEMLYQKAAAELDAQAALELGRDLGVINEASYAALSGLDELRKKYDSNKDGAISAAEAARGYNDAVTELIEKAERAMDMPDEIPFEMRVTVSGMDEMERMLEMIKELGGSDVTAGEGAPAGGDNIAEQEKSYGIDLNGNGVIGAARGADFMVGPGYPNDSMLLGVSSGEHVQVTPAGQKSQERKVYQATFYITGSNAEEIADEVDRRLGEMARLAELVGAEYGEG